MSDFVDIVFNIELSLALGMVTSFVLGFLLLTDKMVAFEFLFLGGIYPILKAYAENLGRRAGKWAAFAVKAVYFNAALALFIVFAKFVFTAGNEDLFAGSAGMIIAAVVFTNAFFAFYDYAMTRFISYYLFVLRKKLKIRAL